MIMKNCRLTGCFFTTGGYDLGLLILRVFAGAFLMTHGLSKIMNFGELSQTFLDPIGLGPQLSLILIVFAEFFCSILVIFGLLTRLALIPMIIGMIVAAFFTFPQFTFEGSEKALLYLVVFVSLMLTGAGRYSIDRLIGRRCAKRYEE